MLAVLVVFPLVAAPDGLLFPLSKAFIRSAPAIMASLSARRSFRLIFLSKRTAVDTLHNKSSPSLGRWIFFLSTPSRVGYINLFPHPGFLGDHELLLEPSFQFGQKTPRTDFSGVFFVDFPAFSFKNCPTLET